MTTEYKLIDTDFTGKKGGVAAPTLPVTDRRDNFVEVELDLNSKLAKAEANRCLICRGVCFLACPYRVPQLGTEDNPKMQKCNFSAWKNGHTVTSPFACALAP